MSGDILQLGVVALAKAIAAGEVTSEQAVSASLAAVAAWQPHINAFISLDRDEAIERARIADKARARGEELGPLHGVPMAHKDMLFRDGKGMTGGSTILRDYQPAGKATVLARLEAAGAITIGALNMSEFAASPIGRNGHVGDCRNPWDASRITGGSSSGSGAAVAAGIVSGALGSDTGGSIRIPAALCGVVGLKGTQGRVSNHASIPRAYSLDCLGPLARHVADCALLMSIIAGKDPGDPATSDEPPPPAEIAQCRPADTTIAVVDLGTIGAIDPKIAARLEAAAEALRRVGFKLRTVAMPDLGPMMALGDVISKCEAAALHRRWMTERPDDYARLVYDRTLSGFLIPATRYIEALAMRGRLLTRFVTDVMGDADALLLPTVASDTTTIDEAARREADGDILPLIAQYTRLTRPFNYLSLPAISFPCGIGSHGMPVGAQFVGRPFDEAGICAIAHVYEREVGFGLPGRPPLPTG